MKAEVSHVRNILINTISLLCKNSLTFYQGLRIQGLLGITLDEEVFLVEISEQFFQKDGESCVAASDSKEGLEEGSCHDVEETVKSVTKTERQRKKLRRHSRTRSSITEEVAETEGNHLTNSTSESFSKTNLFHKSDASSNSSIIHIKEENSVEDEIINLITDSHRASHESSSLPLHRSVTKDIYSDVADLCEPMVRQKTEADVESDNAHPDSCEFLWDANSYTGTAGTNTFTGLGWLEASQNCLSVQSASQARIAEKKCRTQKQGLPSEGKSILDESTLGQRWPVNWPQSRRPATSIHKQFTCDIDDCTRSYYAKKNLLRHQTTVHGRVPTCRRPRLRSLFCQGTGF